MDSGKEVVKIRIGTDEKAALKEVAARECRTFAAQVRLILRKWLKENNLTKREDKMETLLKACRDDARAQGWDGSESDYRYTIEDMEYVTDTLGYKPTRSEWAEAGLRYVGGMHCSEEAK